MNTIKLTQALMKAEMLWTLNPDEGSCTWEVDDEYAVVYIDNCVIIEWYDIVCDTFFRVVCTSDAVTRTLDECLAELYSMKADYLIETADAFM